MVETTPNPENTPITLGSMSLSIYSDIIRSITHEILVESLFTEQVTRVQFGKLIPIQNPLKPVKETPTASLQNSLNNNTQSQTPSEANSRVSTPSTKSVGRIVYHQVAGRDIFGNEKIPDSSRFFICTNCSRKISGNRFAAHIDRCLGGRQRK